jgi:hypothetical protein
MRSIPNTPRARWNSIVSALALASGASAAPLLEAEWSTGAFWFLFAAVQFLWAVGYIASSAPKLLRWVDGSIAGKLEVLSGVACSLIAGNACYYLGYYYANMTHILCLFAAIGGGFTGERYLTPLFMRLMPLSTQKTTDGSA